MKKINTKTLIKEFTETHGDRYDYSLVNYINSSTKVEIVCREHGPFMQNPTLHKKGANCPECSGLKRMNSVSFIKKAIAVHGGKYDYRMVDYKNNKSKVSIICPSHGEFKQNPNNHLSGHGCPYCGNTVPHDTKWFVEQATKVHGSRYSYQQANYTGLDNKVTVICQEHGPFEQTAAHHLKGCNCPVCSNTVPIDLASFLSRAESVHGDRYDYSKVHNPKSSRKVVITCKEHGEFNQSVYLHLSGSGCPICAGVRHTSETFQDKANLVHGNKYQYFDGDYSGNTEYITAVCHKHGEFKVRARDHLNNSVGCIKCSRNYSKKEEWLYKELRKEGFKVVRGDKSLIPPLELDMVIHDKKIAIEFNGVRWHSEKFGKDKHYHANKTEAVKAAGYRLIHVWEDDFDNDKVRELDFIMSSLGVDRRASCYARNTQVCEIDHGVCSEFLEKFHVQGKVNASAYLGLFFEGSLVGVAAFTKRADSFELVRFATSLRVIGGLSKVCKHFSRYYGEKIFSFCDLSRHDGKSYEAAGFVAVSCLKPDYSYSIRGKRVHKFNFRKSAIKAKHPEVYSANKTELQMMTELGIYRVWDCGKVKYEYQN